MRESDANTRERHPADRIEVQRQTYYLLLLRFWSFHTDRQLDQPLLLQLFELDLQRTKLID